MVDTHVFAVGDRVLPEMLREFEHLMVADPLFVVADHKNGNITVKSLSGKVEWCGQATEFYHLKS